MVGLNGKINCLNSKDNKLLSPDLWFDECIQKDESLLIRVGDKYNFFNKIGKFLSEWFDEYLERYEGTEWNLIRKGKKWSVVTSTGYMINKIWFDSIAKYDFPIIRKGEKYNYIGYGGRILSDIWFDKCESFDMERGYGYATLDGKPYWIDTDGDIYVRLEK